MDVFEELAIVEKQVRKQQRKRDKAHARVKEAHAELQVLFPERTRLRNAARRELKRQMREERNAGIAAE